MNVVEFRNVTRTYPKGIVALRDVTWDIPEGSVCGLVGRNGAGKTTLLRMIPALLHPTEGTVRVFGLDPWEAQVEVKGQLGYLSENNVLPKLVRISDLTDLCANLYADWDKQMAVDLLKQFGLDPARRMHELSKGQKRQVGLMCAVAHRPRLLVLDEPAGGLDPVTRRDFLEVVINLLADAGSTIVFSSHILTDLERVANHITILHKGERLVDRPVDELKENICRVELGDCAPPDAASTLAQHPDCVRASQESGHVTATLLCEPDQVADLVRKALPQAADLRVQRTVTLGLEDIFVELTGGRE